ncbi:protein Mpv17 isoform X23 [Gallus gallus]|uniref:protein Mpv17 isoform X23 n=1 Tax=Gallus gallus TaxID=9031 RepID=UPI001F000D62|nr:protein Mpv17 isoform X23 [Gallus gallus]
MAALRRFLARRPWAVQALTAGPRCGRVVQDPGPAHPRGHKSSGREEDGAGSGRLCTVFSRLLPRHHRGGERAVGGAELGQDPAEPAAAAAPLLGWGDDGYGTQSSHCGARPRTTWTLCSPTTVFGRRCRSPTSTSSLWPTGWPSCSVLPLSGTATCPGKQTGCEGGAVLQVPPPTASGASARERVWGWSAVRSPMGMPWQR